MSTGKKVFIVGPGFIGWNFLDLLIAEGYSVTGLVRRKEHGDGIKASGGSIIMGDLNDKTLIKDETALHNITLHTATADHLPSAEAVLDGIKLHAIKGQMSIFIHTSGTSVLDDGSKGDYKSDQVYHDNKREEIDSVPDDAPHRPIDLVIVRAQKELGENAKIAIMIPPMIYGWTHGRGTIQIPTLTRFALKHGYAPHAGKGLAVESDIHVMDLARAYITLLHHLEKSSAEGTLDNPYYFCEGTGDSEHSWKEVAALIGESLHKAGKIQDPEPKEVPEEIHKDLFGDSTYAVLGLNSRSRALRLRELGWEPKEKDWKASFVEDELPEILKEEGYEFEGYTAKAGR